MSASPMKKRPQNSVSIQIADFPAIAFEGGGEIPAVLTSEEGERTVVQHFTLHVHPFGFHTTKKKQHR